MIVERRLSAHVDWVLVSAILALTAVGLATILSVTWNYKTGAPGSEFWTQIYALPIACLVLALIGVALGASNAKEGKLAGFALGSGVVFLYYILLYSPRAAAQAGRIPPALAPWLANLVLGAAGIGLVIWRAGSADQRFALGRRHADQRVVGAGAGLVAGPQRRVHLSAVQPDSGADRL